MLDPQTWERTQPDNSAVPSIDTIATKSLEDSDDLVMLLSSYVYGYSLGDKTWGRTNPLMPGRFLMPLSNVTFAPRKIWHRPDLGSRVE